MLLEVLKAGHPFSVNKISDVTEAIRPDATHPSCVIACCNGIDELADLIEHFPKLPPVIAYSRLDAAANCAEAFRCGFFDYVVRSDDIYPLVQAVHRATRISNLQPRSGSHGNRDALGRLTPREREVLEYIVRGCLNKQTAAELGITEKTVKVHRAKIFKKLNVQNVVGLIHFCYQLGHVPEAASTRSTGFQPSVSSPPTAGPERAVIEVKGNLRELAPSEVGRDKSVQEPLLPSLG